MDEMMAKATKKKPRGIKGGIWTEDSGVPAPSGDPEGVKNMRFGGLSNMIRGAISRAAPAAAPAPSTSMPAPSTSMGSKLGQMAAQAIQNPAPAAPVASNIGGRLNGVVNRLRAGFKMKDGGKVPSSKNSSGSSASKRGDGIAQRGKTKGRMV